MTDEDRNFDDRVRRLVHDAVSDAPDAQLSPPPMAAAPTTSPRGRRATVGALAAAVVVTVAGLMFVGRDRESGVQPAEELPLPTASTPSSAPPTSTAADVSPPSVGTTDGTGPPTESSVAIESEAIEIVRPVAAAERCTTIAASDGHNKPLSFIGRASSNPVPLALFADPTDFTNSTFVMVHRFFDDRAVSGDEFVDIDNTTYGVTQATDGDLEITWQLADSLGHARARGLNRDQLVEFVAALEPRPTDATVAGFEYQPADTSAQLQLTQEINDSEVEGTVARSVCLTDTRNRYRVTALNGDPLFVYSAILDRPAPLETALVGDAAIVINGPAGPAAPLASDVVNAGVSEWQTLLSQPEDENHEATTEGGAAGSDTTVELVGVDGAIEPSELTVRMTTTDGISVLEVDKRGSVLHPDAAYWVIEVDGRIRGAASAFPGGLSGQTLGDLAGRTEPIVARISVVDGGDFILQTTGNIELPPPTN
ncbi:MAG: hypothetical protein WBP59_04115 [Ilumatobacteraceae bacterium]